MLRGRATELLQEFAGERYSFGLDVLDKVGIYAAQFGDSALVIANRGEWLKPVAARIELILKNSGITLAGKRIFPGARPNSPREDVYRIESYLLHYKPACVIVIGGGSSIDAVKAANVLATLGEYDPEIETYLGMGQVSAVLKKTGKKLLPVIAVQTLAGSGAHLTKYSNITDPSAGQKKLIVDESIVPDKAVFDYTLTLHAPLKATVDGVLDGIAHCLEVFYGATTAEKYDLIREIAQTGIELAVKNTLRIIERPQDLEARENIGLATDLGGYSIMIGGTNGAHLTSFSLVDIASHGQACGIMNPYYTVFYAPAIERQLRVVGAILRHAGFLTKDLDVLNGRTLGVVVAEGLIAFNKSVGSPTRLSDVPGFTEAHIKRALVAAKTPELEMKLKNMPVPLNASMVDEYMGPILESAKTGNFNLIRNLSA